MSNVNSATAGVYDQYALPTSSSANQDLGQEEFLKLMTTQLSHQDPFSPMENGEFLSQMAQFGTVSGIKELQNSFGALSAALQSNRALQASVMVGKEVLVASPTAELPAEGELKAAVALPPEVSQVKVKITDSSGQLLHEMTLPAASQGLTEFSWNGVDTKGHQQAAGVYSVSAEAMYNGQSQRFQVLAAANVDSVTMGRGFSDLTLNLSGLGEVALGQVRQIR